MSPRPMLLLLLAGCTAPLGPRQDLESSQRVAPGLQRDACDPLLREVAPSRAGVRIGSCPATARTPCGVYLLSTRDESGTSVRFLGDRDHPFVAGFVARPGWSDLEPSAGVFDFSSVDDVLPRLASNGQRLTLQILGAEPAHVMPDATDTWTWFDPNPRHTGDCSDADGCERPLPWDPGALARQEALVTALANHMVPHDGTMVRFADHPALDQVLLPLVGWGRVRELGFEVEDWTGYTRQRLMDATVDNLLMHYEHFGDVDHQLQFFAVRDGAAGSPLWEELQDAIITELVDAGHPPPVFMMENLAHSVQGGIDRFGPNPSAAGAPIVRADALGAPTGMQMLTSWTRPFTGTNAVLDGSPIEAMHWAWSAYGARYHEVYTVDVDASVSGAEPWLAGFEDLGQTLCD